MMSLISPAGRKDGIIGFYVAPQRENISHSANMQSSSYPPVPNGKILPLWSERAIIVFSRDLNQKQNTRTLWAYDRWLSTNSTKEKELQYDASMLSLATDWLLNRKQTSRKARTSASYDPSQEKTFPTVWMCNHRLPICSIAGKNTLHDAKERSLPSKPEKPLSRRKCAKQRSPSVSPSGKKTQQGANVRLLAFPCMARRRDYRLLPPGSPTIGTNHLHAAIVRTSASSGSPTRNNLLYGANVRSSLYFE